MNDLPTRRISPPYTGGLTSLHGNSPPLLGFSLGGKLGHPPPRWRRSQLGGSAGRGTLPGGRDGARPRRPARRAGPPMGTVVNRLIAKRSPHHRPALAVCCLVASVHRSKPCVSASAILRFLEASDVSLLFAFRSLRRACIM